MIGIDNLSKGFDDINMFLLKDQFIPSSNVIEILRISRVEIHSKMGQIIMNINVPIAESTEKLFKTFVVPIISGNEMKMIANAQKYLVMTNDTFISMRKSAQCKKLFN